MEPYRGSTWGSWVLSTGSPQVHNHRLFQGRLLLLILCSLTLSALYVFLCCWACLPLCLATCLDHHLPAPPRSTVPGPLHFRGYSSVPDGKVSQPGNAKGASGSPAPGNSGNWAGGKPAWTLSLTLLLTSCVASASHLSTPSTQGYPRRIGFPPSRCCLSTPSTCWE